MPLKTYYFNTGVKQYPGSKKDQPGWAGGRTLDSLMLGQVFRGGTLQIPFVCAEVPPGSRLEMISADDKAPGYQDTRVFAIRPIVGGESKGRYAYFRLPYGTVTIGG